ncbi:hypothetical protein [Pseudoclavibacter sp. VKM Ac-2867]|uniref:hypothetical protein n=1 Tax=Pseudoclavibacter sp. VKM Ac-2867 TaxID=2783829 RepID=UPI00188C3F3F|nr:hypothetical protein [Pseudoclavibacter sp. VKM Ac-2867]MBF4459506.1 hypothetical protein [Pseudoclavibacter sp. VKM Ac-2867]
MPEQERTPTKAEMRATYISAGYFVEDEHRRAEVEAQDGAEFDRGLTRITAQVLAEERAKRPDREQVNATAEHLRGMVDSLDEHAGHGEIAEQLEEARRMVLALEPETREVTEADVRRAHRGWVEAESGRTFEDWEFDSLRSDAQARLIRAALEAFAQS